MIDPDRLAGAPISWGVCEVPGWGVMLPAERVLDEMRQLGLAATELGAPGFLPDDTDELSATLARHEMRLVGGFVPVVVHDPAVAATTRAAATATAEHFRRAGGEVFVSALVVDAAWSRPWSMSDTELGHTVAMLAELDEICAAHGLVHVVHPHVGTLIESADDVRRLLAASTVRWCLDTGHLAIGGYDPAAFARDAGDRVAHVHLKDVDSAVATAVADGTLDIRTGVQRGLFRPLGEGDVAVAETVIALETQGYGGWYVLEQDADLGTVAPPVGSGPVDDVGTSLAFLQSLATAV